MTEMTAAQAKCYEALKSYGKPFAGGNLSFARKELPGFKGGPAEALVRKGLVVKTWNAEEKCSYYSIA